MTYYTDVIHADSPYLYYSTDPDNRIGPAPTIGSQVTVDDVDWIGDEPVLNLPGSAGGNSFIEWASAGLSGSTDNVSVEYWMKAPPTTKSRAYTHFIYDGTYLNALRIEPPVNGYFSQVGFIPGHGEVSDTPKVDDNQWHHIVVTNTPSQMRIYVDGVLRATDGASVSGSTNSTLLFGRHGGNTTADRAYTGKLAHMALYQYTLSDEQISEHYEAGFVSSRKYFSIGSLYDSNRKIDLTPIEPVNTSTVLDSLGVSFSATSESGENSAEVYVNVDGTRVETLSVRSSLYKTTTFNASPEQLATINSGIAQGGDGIVTLEVWVTRGRLADNPIIYAYYDLAEVSNEVVVDEAASGSAEAVEPYSYGPADRTMAVDAMVVNGTAGDTSLVTDQHLSTTAAGGSAEMLPPTLNSDLGYIVEGIPYGSVSVYGEETETRWRVYKTLGGQIESLNIYPPADLAPHLKGAADAVVAKSISVTVSGTSSIYVRTYAEDGTLLTNENWSPPYSPGQVRYTLPIPVETKYVQFYANINISSGGMYIYKDPAPTFNVTAVGDPGAYPTVEAMSASADMPDVAVSVTISADVDVEPMSALGEVGTVTFPDWTQEVVPFEAFVEMEDAWFKSDLRQTVEPAVASGEALDAATASDNNIYVSVNAMEGNGYAFDPDEVNQDMGDRLFEEIAKDNPVRWFRLNERIGEGNVAWQHSPSGRMPASTENPRVFGGEYSRNIAGPGGRRAVDITSAHLIGHTLTDGGRPNIWTASDDGWANETIFRTEEETGTLASGVFSPRYNTGVVSSSIYGYSIGIKDGYIVAAGGLYPRIDEWGRPVQDRSNEIIITSHTKVNDGKWHHVVVQTSQDFGTSPRSSIGIEIYIDGKLDRRVLYINASGVNTAFFASPPNVWFDSRGTRAEWETPFVGQVLEVAWHNRRLEHSRINEHFYGLWNIIPVRPSSMGALGAAGDHKAESNMRRMLILNFSRTWGRHSSGQTGPWQLFQSPGKSSENRSVIDMTDQFGTDWVPNVLETMDVTDTEDFAELGDLQITYQRVEMVHDSETIKQGWSAVGWNSEERGHSGLSVPFTDTFSGKQRFINLQRDIVDLEEYDIIYVQGYPNWTIRNQEDRLKAEAFLNSVNQAIVDGSKFWITNPMLAADLGLISKHEIVPTVMTMRNTLDGRLYWRGGTPILEHISGKETSSIVDARSWQLYPWNDKEAPFEIPEGIETATQMYDHLRQVAPTIVDSLGDIPSTRYSERDAWANNQFRVVNEVEGLTTFPSYEVEAAAVAERLRSIFSNAEEYDLLAYRYENRTGEDDPWGYTESKGVGLKPGDEFIDLHILASSFGATSGMAHGNTNNRGNYTYAIPPGHLKTGRAVTTFGSTIWQDNGKQGINPYKDHITTAVVIPGDRINGKLVGGYVFMQFSERAHTTTKMQYLPIDRNPWVEGEDLGWNLDELEGWSAEPGRNGRKGWEGLTDYARSWHYASHRRASQARGNVAVASGGEFRLTPILDASGGIEGYKAISTRTQTDLLPLAPLMSWRFGTVSVPHATWNFRGIRWLMNATPKLAGAVNTLAGAAEATGSMRDVVTYSEKDTSINVVSANAYGVLIPSDNVTGKDVQAFVIAATATGGIVEPGRTIFIGPMTAIGDMGGQSNARVELGEVNWLTINRNRNIIELRVEEVGVSTASLMTIAGQVIETGGN